MTFVYSKDELHENIYEYSIEEVSFLYEQKLDLFCDKDVVWSEIHDLSESRVEAHIDALVIGGNLALNISKQQATEGDFGELHAAVCVFSWQI